MSIFAAVMKRIIGYVRVSTVAQDVERQKKLIRDYVASNGYVLARSIEVDKVSGAKSASDRKGLNNILSLTSEDADVVVISELSRLSREDDIMSVMQEIHQILNNGLDLVLLDEPDKIYSANQHLSLIDFISLAIKAYGAAEERKKITERMKTGKYSKLADTPNMLCTAIIPFGFKAVPNPEYVGKPDTARTILVEDEEEAKIVRMMYQMILDGKTVRDVAYWIEDMQVKGKRKNVMNFSTVHRILRSKLYNGIRTIKGKEYKIDKLIDDETWNNVQAKIDFNKNFKGKRNEYFNPLKGIVKCPCGRNLTICHHGNGKYANLFCAERAILGNSRNKKPTCTNYGINYYWMMKAVWNIVRSVSLSSDYKIKNDMQINNIKALNAGLLETIDSYKDAIKRLQKDIDIITENIACSTNATVVAKLNNKVGNMESEVEKLNKAIGKAKKDIRKNELKIKDMSRNLTEIEFDSYTDRQKADEFRRRLERVTYYSENMRRGFIVATFKNGAEFIALYRIIQKPKLYQLPSSFSFNPVTKKVVVEVHNEWKKEYVEYDVLGLVASFDLTEYEIK